MKSFSPSSAPRKPLQFWLSDGQLAAFATTQTNAHRIFTGPGAWIERFGDDLLISWQNEEGRELAVAGLAGWEAANGHTHRRAFGKFIPLRNDERTAPTLWEGDPAASLETVALENGMKFGLDFAAGYSAGLFIDQRANRTAVRHGGVRRLLNTFAYTCSFSVAAALGGAETVSVDLSKKSLDRGRDNFALNGLATDGHRFLADDVLDVIPRLARRGETFDAIILDPPTFSRGNKGRRFQVEQDFETLLLATLEVAAPRAKILLSTNCTRLTRRALENIARLALKTTRRAADFRTEPPLPDFPADAGAQTLWLLLK